MDKKSIGNSVRMLNKINNRLWIENYELLKYQDKNNAVQTARQRRRNAKTTALFFDH
jgi:hypothetical protein